MISGYETRERDSLLLRRFVFRMAEASAKRVTGDEPQGTMGRVQTPLSDLSLSRLPLRAQFHQKRDVWVRGRERDVSALQTPKFRRRRVISRRRVSTENNLLS